MRFNVRGINVTGRRKWIYAFTEGTVYAHRKDLATCTVISVHIDTAFTEWCMPFVNLNFKVQKVPEFFLKSTGNAVQLSLQDNQSNLMTFISENELRNRGVL